MRVVQAVFGVFHHFALARQLEKRGHLARIYSTWPWMRVKREGLPHAKVETFPWIHTATMLQGRIGLRSQWLDDELGVANALIFDRWTARRIPPCDAFIAISGAGLKTGRLVQQRGGIFICDRGSSHQRYQERIVAEEYARWGVSLANSDERDTVREEAIYAQADAITVPSQFAAQSFTQQGIDAAKIHVIPYGVELAHCTPAAGPPPAETFEALFVGGVGLRKGVPYLLEAFARVQHPRKRLRVIGSLGAEMRDVLARLPQQQVEMLGRQPKSVVLEAMRSSHVLVLPSIEEGLALVLAEALACGCPVIASTNTGAGDLFTDGREGFIVGIRDADALADRMQRLADDPALQHRMRLAGMERVQSLGGWDAYGAAWDSLLHRLTGK
jgi:starch synthase